MPGPTPLILGSLSPRRAELLRAAGFDFEIKGADVTEAHDPSLSPRELTLWNARLKGTPLSSEHPDAITVSADTLVYRDEVPLGKPATPEAAIEMLLSLSGRIHEVCTGVCLMKQGRILAELAIVTQVWFKPLTRQTIEHYHQLCDPMDKAGAYGIQTSPELIIDRIWGSRTNVMGLPIDEVTQALASFGLHPR